MLFTVVGEATVPTTTIESSALSPRLKGNEMRIKLALFAAAALLALSLLQGQVAHAATITVNTTDDELNSDGDCSLREALLAANTDAAVDACIAGSGADTILLAAGIYTLSIPGTNEDAAATGDLDIADDLTLTGAGALTTVIDGNQIDRVIEVADSVTAHVSGVTIRNGESVSFAFNGGGIANFGDLTFTDSIVTGNSVVDGGGGILNVGTLTMTNVSVKDNISGMDVGGIANLGSAVLTGVTVSGNEAAGFVGGIYNNGSLTLNGSAVSGNSALIAGGIYNEANFFGDVQLTIVNTTISGNSAGAAGGGIYNFDSPVTITNSTISGNNGGDQGGGIYNYEDTVVLLNSTVSGNMASEGGGIYNVGAASLTNTTLKNTIVANSTGADCGGSPITSEGNNIDSDGTCGLTDTSDLVNTDPLLGPLADNGGPTQTHALLAGSPAIDAGSGDCPPPATDQRGVARPQSAACDIGAFESTPPFADTDADGVPDADDACPDEPGEPFQFGCPDSDGDFMPDPFDACPSQPGELHFEGCPDSDGDFMPDPFDACPSQPGELHFEGCPDSDGDFMPDRLDACPSEPGEPLFEGCPDSDFDFVPDRSDACPSEPGELLFEGCPDSDGDFVPDRFDACPSDPGPFVGCPDSDGDGIPDQFDACPLEPGPPEFGGCPDSDSIPPTGVELGSITSGFGFGCTATAEGFVLSYGLFDMETLNLTDTTIFDGLLIGPSNVEQTFYLFSSDDPDFDAVASALTFGAPPGTSFGYNLGFGLGEFCAGAGGDPLAISVPPEATIEFFRLTIPPFSIVCCSQISPSTAQFSLSAFGPPPSGSGETTDSDVDGLPDQFDACPLEPGDPLFGGCPDSDGDFVPDPLDQCPLEPGDLLFGGCPDSDGDFVPDPLDQCPLERGDAIFAGCPDSDSDGFADPVDNCPSEAGIFVGCPDSDSDGFADPVDICPSDAGIFVGCPDSDGDGIPDPSDSCPLDPGPPEFSGCPDDSDGDGVLDGSDNCPNDPNPDQADTDADGKGDACDPDDDNDGLPDSYELAHTCLDQVAPDALADPDTDGLNNVDEFDIGTDPCNPDTDNDGLLDGVEVSGFGPFGTDPLDSDSDDDGHLDGADNCPKSFHEETGQSGFNPDQADLDGDGKGNVCDPDADGDGVANSDDSCPLSSTEGFDADVDGCRDTLPEFSAYVNGLENLSTSVRNNILRTTAAATSLICDDGNIQGGLKKLESLVKYIGTHSGKNGTSAEVADVLEVYVENLIRQVQAGQDVCSSP